MAEDTNSPSLFKDLWERRFFQYFATYLGAGWAAIQFGEWMVQRYGFSDNLIEKIITFLLICLPAFLVFVYNHGKAGHDDWKPYEKIMIPVSLLLAVGISTFAFKGPAKAKTAAAAVSIETEGGEIITRQVPTIESNRRAIFFPFENKGKKNEKLDWLRFGLPYLMDKDLEQDMRIYSINPTSLKGDYESLDLDYHDNVPLASMVKIAQDHYSDFFVTGTFEDGKTKKLSVKVYSAENAKLFFKKEFEGDNYYDLVDEFSEEMKSQIYLEKEFGGGETVMDLPSQDLVSSNFEAFQNQILGMLSLNKNVNDSKTATSFFSKSIELDDKCSECYAMLAICSSLESDVASSRKHIAKANQLASSLPERQRLGIQQRYYNFRQEPEKARLLLNTWMKLYPSDYTPYANLIQYYSISFQYDKAKEIGQQAIKAGHKGRVLIQLADLYIATEDFDEAEKYLNQFEAAYPHKARNSSSFSDLYLKKGEWDKAKSHLEKINITNPGDISTILKLGDLEEKTGNYAKALNYYDEALAFADHSKDTVEVYGYFEKYYTRFGKINKAIDYQEQRFAIMNTYIPIINVDIQKLQSGIRYVWVNRTPEFQTLADNFKTTHSQNPFFSCFADWMFSFFTENKDGFIAACNQCGAMITASSGKNVKYMMDGFIAKLEGDYQKSMENYEIYIDSTGVGEILMGEMMSEIFRKGGEVKKAKNFIEKVLKNDPSQTTYLLELAKVQLAEGNKSEAKKTVEQCLEIWKEADPEYTYYQQAIEFKKTLD